MRIRPDDDIYRARLVFLGPRGYTMPIQLPYVAYPLFAANLAIVILLRFLITGGVDIFPGMEIAMALVLTGVVLRRVSPDRSVRAVLRTAATDWRRGQSLDEKADRVTGTIRVRKALL